MAALGLLIAAAASVPALAQEKDPVAKRERMPQTSEHPVDWAPSAPPSEANIAAILMAANESAVKDARLAESKATNPAVQSLARTEATDHAALEESAVAWMKEHQVEPVENASSEAFTSRGVKSRDKLQGLDAAHFDRGYVSERIHFDKDLLDTLHHDMIPNAKDPQLAALLKGAVPKVEAHMKSAEQLESTLKA
jgi:putative membrane protein